MKYCPLCGSDLAVREIEGRSRLACTRDSCSYVFWDNPIPVVAALVERKGEVILVRNKDWPAKIFGLVSGFLEKAEHAESGVLREVKEELGKDGRIVDFIGYYSFFQMNQLILAFHVSIDGDVVLGEELAEIKIVPSDRLRPWNFGTGLAVQDWLDKRRKSR
jgi:NAD+ diphosphatase